MTNQQTPEPISFLTDMLDVHSIWPTIQGEGPFAGKRAVFLRLAGCNLMCPMCDTNYTSKRLPYTPSDLVANLIRCWEDSFSDLSHIRKGLLVITGGEPYRQKAIVELVRMAIDEDFTVQIETNGTMSMDLPYHNQQLLVVCSPKTSAINSATAHAVSAWKYILSHDAVNPMDGLPTSALGMRQVPARPPMKLMDSEPHRIYLQPLDTGEIAENKRNVKAVVESCMRFGYRLNLQIHKLVGLA